jgi:hypothetical protein
LHINTDLIKLDTIINQHLKLDFYHLESAVAKETFAERILLDRIAPRVSGLAGIGTKAIRDWSHEALGPDQVWDMVYRCVVGLLFQSSLPFYFFEYCSNLGCGGACAISIYVGAASGRQVESTCKKDFENYFPSLRFHSQNRLCPWIGQNDRFGSLIILFRCSCVAGLSMVRRRRFIQP